MGLVLLVVLGIIAIIVLNILKAKGVNLPGVRAAAGARPGGADDAVQHVLPPICLAG